MSCDSRNPYVTDDPPTLRKSVVAFIDILGFKELISSVKNQPESNELLRNIHKALKATRKYIDPDIAETVAGKWMGKDFFAISAFTDNIVIGHPIFEDGEWELGAIFGDLSRFQLCMALEGYFFRGAIAVGDLYIDEYVVFGAGLIEAHQAESNSARDPRIVLAPSAMQSVKNHLMYYGNEPHAPQNSDLLEDSDGQYFLNYLEALVDEEDGELDVRSLTLHKQTVEAKLHEFQKRPAIWSKYFWVANYHNTFCEWHAKSHANVKIATEQFALRPVHIIEHT